MTENIGKLTTALAAVSRSVGSLQPDKRNAQQSYDYISADKILATIGKELAGHGLAVIPSIVDDSYDNLEYTDNYGKAKTRIDARCRFVMHITHESGETCAMPWTGYGTDYVTPDKALYKAITSGHKYFLMKLFNVGIGNEDGEHESHEEPTKIIKKTAAKQPPPNGKASDLTPPMPTEEMKRLFHKHGVDFYGDSWDDERPRLVTYITNKRQPKPDSEIKTSNDLYRAEMQSLIDGLVSKLDEREQARELAAE